MLHALPEHSCEDAAVSEFLSAWSVLQVALPVANILLTILIDIGSKPASLTVNKLALILIAIWMADVADSVCYSVPPLTFVRATIGPHLQAVAVLHFIAVDDL